MRKEWVKLVSISSATTRNVQLSADLIRKIVPNATKNTPLYGRWEFDENTNSLRLFIKEGPLPQSEETNTQETSNQEASQ
jgi:hypothetical protein